jgi:hypothetical protein
MKMQPELALPWTNGAHLPLLRLSWTILYPARVAVRAAGLELRNQLPRYHAGRWPAS